jgi:hypothetical protein
MHHIYIYIYVFYRVMRAELSSPLCTTGRAESAAFNQRQSDALAASIKGRESYTLAEGKAELISPLCITSRAEPAAVNQRQSDTLAASIKGRVIRLSTFDYHPTDH